MDKINGDFGDPGLPGSLPAGPALSVRFIGCFHSCIFSGNPI